MQPNGSIQPATEPAPAVGSTSVHAEKLQLSEVVAMHLREQVISGKLHAGEFLRIEAIAKRLDVSTTPVREGLLLLQSESLVELIPRRGFLVKSFSERDLADSFWVQAAIGAELAARAAKQISKSDLARLDELCIEQERAIAAGDEATAANVGHQFHRIINLAADSPRLALLLGSLTKQLHNRFYARIAGRLQSSTRYHPLILNALRLQDANSARSLMHSHIQSGGEYLIAALKSTPNWQFSRKHERAKVSDATRLAKRLKGRPMRLRK